MGTQSANRSVMCSHDLFENHRFIYFQVVWVRPRTCMARGSTPSGEPMKPTKLKLDIKGLKPLSSATSKTVYGGDMCIRCTK